MRWRWMHRSCALALLGAAILASCGGGEEASDDVAATVGDAVIAQADVDRFIDVLFPYQGGYRRAFGPPGYPHCMKAKLEFHRPGKNVGHERTPAQLKRECRLEFHNIRAQTLSYLIRARWLDRETRRRGLPTVDDQPARLRIEAQERALEASIAVRPEEVALYGRQNPTVFAASERRRVHIVQTRTWARAKRAFEELRRGRAWPAVVRAHTLRPRRDHWGGLHVVREASVPHDRFGRDMFTAPVGELMGPVATLNGWFVYRIERVWPGSSRLSPEARRTIVHTIRVKRLDRLLRARYGSETRCVDRYRIPESPMCI
jgi:hypothetical protein